MSLKAFHLFFITVSILFAIGFTYWEFNSYRTEGQLMDLALVILSFLTALGLIYYCTRFVKKMRTLKPL